MSRGAGRGNVTIDNELTVNGTVSVEGLVTVPYDSVYLTYTGVDLTGVVYKLASTPVATLTLAYTSNILQSVVKS
jgi:hypothetical protein